MLEAYSTNITVTTNTAIPFNNVTIEKGNTAKLAAPATIELNKAGVYMVSVNVAGTATSAGDVSIQLSKDGNLQPQAQSISTGTTTGVESLSFITLVQVSQNNTCSCCTSPTVVRVINTGVPTTYNITNIAVTKIC